MAVNFPPEPVAGRSAALRERVVAALPWIALLAAFLFSMFWGIRSFGIQDNNEGIYAEIAREMKLRGDWVIPHLDGAPYLEKPPLLYWIEASLLTLFGEHEWVVRLGPVLCFAATLAGVVWIGRQMRSWKLGRSAAVLLCSAVGVVGMSRSLLFDGPLTCALTWALAFFLQWRLTGSRWSLRAVYAVLGVGVMAKGLIALVLGGGTLLVASWLGRRSWRSLLELADGAGLALFAAIVVPWHVLASLREPGFAEFYFINEHVKRFLGSREPHDFYTGPIYYYLVRLPLYLGVWVFALPMLANRRRAAGARPVAEVEGRRLLVCATVIALAFFSLSEGKANYYLLSVMPTCALLVAEAWPANGSRRRRLLVCAVGIGVIGAVLAAAPFALRHNPKAVVYLQGQEILLTSLGVVILGLAGIVAWLGAQRRHGSAFWAIAAAGLLVLVPLPTLLQHADETLSERAVAQYLEGREGPVVLYHEYESLSSFVFYRHGPVPVVDSESNELYYAHQRYRTMPVFLDAEHLHALARQRNVWVVTTPSHTDEVLRLYGAEAARVVRRFPRAVVMSLGSTYAAARLPAASTRAYPIAVVATRTSLPR